MATVSSYPNWKWYSESDLLPEWVEPFLKVFSDSRRLIDSKHVRGLKSDDVLAVVQPGLTALGYEVEMSKKKADKVFRTVLWDERDQPTVTYEIDAAHKAHGIVVEIEASRAILGNAFYRDLVRTSLIPDARFLVIGVANTYQYKTKGKLSISRDYKFGVDELDALFSSGRLRLPFEGVLLLGY